MVGGIVVVASVVLAAWVGLRDRQAAALPGLEPPIPSSVVRAVDSVLRTWASPLAPDAAGRIEQVFTPADAALPSFFRVPAKTGGACLVTSSGVITGCSRANVPGTLTVMDDSEADGIPAFVFGQASSEVVAVVVEFDGNRKEAEIRDGFYLFQLPSPSIDDASVTAVTFKLANGTTRTIRTS